MLGFGKLMSAVTTLAANLTALARTVETINTGLRAKLLLDDQADAPALLEAPPEVASSNGRRKSKAAAE